MNDESAFLPTTILLLLILLHFKHFLADFPFQTKYMLRKSAAQNWIMPLLSHTAVHATLTGLVTWPFIGVKHALLCALFDFFVHSIVDFWKARFTNTNPFQKSFWTAFGFDQLLHQLTYITIAFYAVWLAVS